MAPPTNVLLLKSEPQASVLTHSLSAQPQMVAKFHRVYLLESTSHLHTFFSPSSGMAVSAMAASPWVWTAHSLVLGVEAAEL